MPWFIVGGVLIVILLWGIAAYNSLIRKKVYVGEAWASIDVQLKRKGNVLPNLVDTIKMQTGYEGDLLTKLTQARSGIIDGSNEERMKADNELTRMMPSLYAVSESYPQLGANESYRQLMSEISDCEDKIAYSRNRYNIAVTTLNTAIQVFPTLIIAGMMGLKAEPFFEIDEQKRTDIDNMRIKDIQ